MNHAQVRGYTGQIGARMDEALHAAMKQGWGVTIVEAVQADGSNPHPYVIVHGQYPLSMVTRAMEPTEFMKEFANA